MTTTDADALVADYLDRLARAGADLPASHRDELLEQIADHLAAARSSGADSPARIRQVLDELGDPAEVAAAAREQSGVGTPGTPVTGTHLFGTGTGRESAAVVLLGVGWIFVGLGWLFGMVLAWTSPRWSRGEKLVATALPVPVVGAAVLVHALGSADVPGVVRALVVLLGVAGALGTGAVLVRRAYRPAKPRP